MLIVVLAATTLIGVALIKPWSHSTPVAPPPPPPVALVTPAPATPHVTAVPATPPPPLDQAVVLRSLSNAPIGPRDVWGIRALIVEPRSVSEVWVPVGRGGAANLGSDADFSWIGDVGVISGLGITTPLSDLPLDVRAWRMGGTGWQPQPVIAVAPAHDPTSRLLTLAGRTQPETAWPAGTYRIDLLQEHGVRHIQLTLTGQAAPQTDPPRPRQPPSAAQLKALIAAPGAFIESGTSAASFLSAGIAPSVDGQHRDADAWLALRAQQPFPVGTVHPIPSLVGTANLLGVAAGKGQDLVAVWLTMMAPISRDLGRAQLITITDPGKGPRVPGTTRRAVAIFHPPDTAGFPDGTYRIDALLLQDGKPGYLSWDVPLMPASQGTESPLLAGLRAWSDMPTYAWTTIAPGRRSVLAPSTATGLPVDPGTDCRGAAALGTTPPYVGVTHPGANFDNVSVYRLDGVDAGAAVPVEISQLVSGLVVVRPIDGDWQAGRYTVQMRTDLVTQQLAFCAR